MTGIRNRLRAIKSSGVRVHQPIDANDQAVTTRPVWNHYYRTRFTGTTNTFTLPSPSTMEAGSWMLVMHCNIVEQFLVGGNSNLVSMDSTTIGLWGFLTGNQMCGNAAMYVSTGSKWIIMGLPVNESTITQA